LIEILEELDRKQRKIRSLRGFFLYACSFHSLVADRFGRNYGETMVSGKDLEILRTNLQSSFWRKLKRILRQNKKAVLLEFLFGSQGSTLQTHLTKELEEKIQIFKNQIASLQERVIHLENQNLVMEGKLNMLSADDRRSKSHTLKREQSDSTLKQNKAENESNFVPIPSGNDAWLRLSQIAEQEKIEIIQRGFQLQAQGKISLKNYYETTAECSLFQLKGYNII
jgi:TolA-binding protein